MPSISSEALIQNPVTAKHATIGGIAVGHEMANIGLTVPIIELLALAGSVAIGLYVHKYFNQDYKKQT